MDKEELKKILEQLRITPNLTKISREIKLPGSTLRYNIKQLYKKEKLIYRAILNYPALNLKTFYLVDETEKSNLSENPQIRYALELANGLSYLYVTALSKKGFDYGKILPVTKILRPQKRVTKWDFDELDSMPTKIELAKKNVKKEPDYLDKIICFEKEVNPFEDLQKILQKSGTKMTFQGMDYHYKSHVKDKLILGYEAELFEDKPLFLYHIKSEQIGKIANFLASKENVKDLYKIEDREEILVLIEADFEDITFLTDFFIKCKAYDKIKSFQTQLVIKKTKFKKFNILS